MDFITYKKEEIVTHFLSTVDQFDKEQSYLVFVEPSKVIFSELPELYILKRDKFQKYNSGIESDVSVFCFTERIDMDSFCDKLDKLYKHGVVYYVVRYSDSQTILRKSYE